MDKVKKFVLNIVISFGITAIFLCLTAVLFAYTNINDRHLQTFVFGIVLLSNLLGSTLLLRKIKEKGLIYGGIFGAVYCIILYLVTSLIFNNFSFTNTLGIYFVICILSGIIGGVIGVNI